MLALGSRGTISSFFFPLVGLLENQLSCLTPPPGPASRTLSGGSAFCSPGLFPLSSQLLHTLMVSHLNPAPWRGFATPDASFRSLLPVPGALLSRVNVRISPETGGGIAIESGSVQEIWHL